MRLSMAKRAKGFVRGEDGTMLHLEYVCGIMETYPTSYAGVPKNVIIGDNLADSGQLDALAALAG